MVFLKIKTDPHRPGYYLAEVKDNGEPRYPFQEIMFANGSSTGALALAAPFYAKKFYRVRAGCILPKKINSPSFYLTPPKMFINKYS